jgi:hypothetical protein
LGRGGDESDDDDEGDGDGHGSGSRGVDSGGQVEAGARVPEFLCVPGLQTAASGPNTAGASSTDRSRPFPRPTAAHSSTHCK